MNRNVLHQNGFDKNVAPRVIFLNLLKRELAHVYSSQLVAISAWNHGTLYSSKLIAISAWTHEMLYSTQLVAISAWTHGMLYSC